MFHVIGCWKETFYLYHWNHFERFPCICSRGQDGWMNSQPISDMDRHHSLDLQRIGLGDTSEMKSYTQ